MYAVLKTGGKQYVVSQGDLITVERIPAQEGETVELEDVLLVADEEGVKLGQPLVDGARVRATVVENGRLRKVIVFKYKRRKRYRRKKGHRQEFSRLRIDEIVVG